MAKYKCNNVGKFAVLFSQALLEFFLQRIMSCPPLLLHLVVVEGLSALHINVLWLWRRSELVSCHLAQDQKQCAWAWATVCSLGSLGWCHLRDGSLCFTVSIADAPRVLLYTYITLDFTSTRLYLEEKALYRLKKTSHHLHYQSPIFCLFTL